MNPRNLVSAFAALSLFAAVGCSSDPKPAPKQNPVAKAIYETNEIPEPTKVKVKETDRLDFATIEFDLGESKLSEMDRRHLNELAMKMTAAGKIVDDVKILTWADRTIKNDQDGSSSEIILARQRAESIKKYLEKNLPTEEDIDFYNMAENPQRFSSFMQRKGVPVNKVFTNASGKQVSTDGRALVIIEYQNEPMPSQL